MCSNRKRKQQVQRLKSPVVNFPKFLSRFSFRDTNEFATETKQSLSNLSCVFKIARWLSRGFVLFFLLLVLFYGLFTYFYLFFIFNFLFFT